MDYYRSLKEAVGASVVLAVFAATLWWVHTNVVALGGESKPPVDRVYLVDVYSPSKDVPVIKWKFKMPVEPTITYTAGGHTLLRLYSGDTWVRDELSGEQVKPAVPGGWWMYLRVIDE